MNFFKLCWLCGAFLLLSTSVNFSQNRIKYDFDYSIFGYDSSSNYMEIYYSLDNSSFEANNSSVSIEMSIRILNTSKDTVINKRYFFNDSLKSKNSNESIGVLKFVIPQENLFLELSILDKNNPGNYYNKKYDILSADLLSGSNQISDVQLARLIINDTTISKNIFDKNNYTVIPNPSLIYDNQFSQLYFYTELYNLKKNKGKLFFKQQLSDSRERVIYKRNSSLLPAAKSKVQVGLISLKGLESGSYILLLQVVDSLQNVHASSKKRFYYHTKIKENNNINSNRATDYLGSEFAVYSEEECDNMMAKIRYVATQNELNQYKTLTALDTKRSFLFQFWEKRDLDKLTIVNEYKAEVLKRVNEADKRFGALKKEGSTTDRGRVLILYGMPDEIDRYPNESGYKPYEIWKYHSIEGGVIFVFGDIIGLEDFRLLHSTKQGELRQPNWLTSLRGN